ncbi:MAG: peptidylprolyl isomerase [bacterium]
MKVLGTVKDAVKELPIEDAQIGLFIRGKELALLYSDKEGRFEHKEAAQYIGESLIFKVEKEGFKSQDITYKVEYEEVQLDIELVPLFPEVKEKNNLTIIVKDKQNNLLEGVKITLEADEEQISAGFSDKKGLFKISLAHDLKDKKIKYTAEHGDFEPASGKIRLKEETALEVTMEKLSEYPKPRKWIKIAIIVGALLIAGIAACFFIFRIPNTPQIVDFKAGPLNIYKGDQSILAWETENAIDVEILPDIGAVSYSGSRIINPIQTTTYTLIAKNEKGETVKRHVKIQVIIPATVPLPRIVDFNASQYEIDKGDQSILTWETTDAVDVQIRPDIGNVNASGSKPINPSQTTTYTLIAKNKEGKTVKKDLKVQVIIPIPAPVPLPRIVDFKASQYEIDKGEQSTLTWETEDTVDVQIRPDIGNVNASGSMTISPTQTTIYTLIAKNEKGKSIDKKVQIQVKIPLPQIVYFEASPSEIEKGKQSTLTWETSDTADVKILPDIGGVNASGDRAVSPSRTTSYTLIAKNEKGKSIDKKVQIRVKIPLPQIVYFKVSPPETGKGEPFTLTWETANAVDVKLLPDIGDVNAFGDRAVSPTQTTTYTLIAKNEEGKSIEKDIVIQVTLPFTTETESVKNPFVLIETTMGNIKVEIFQEKAPVTAKNFLSFVDEGVYNGTIFHRIIKDFMIQGGGFSEDMREKTRRPVRNNEAENKIGNIRGTVAMARTPYIYNPTSQFFINLRDNIALNHKDKSLENYRYCVFGRVIEGMEVADMIGRVPTTRKDGHENVPVEPVIILSIHVL